MARRVREARAQFAYKTGSLDAPGTLSKNFRAEEMAWLQENMTHLSSMCPGEWIAVDGAQLVAHADTLPALLDAARRAGHPNPLVTAAPREPVLS
ncbi:MAG: hypothetical protein HYX92_02660 [Chloroflexi bacterium]|nr:hypothetical protein [Chloroflexota bacterium]